MRTSEDTAAPWRATAAYLYVLELDAPALAWEYLRRHPAYRAAWRRAGRAGTASAQSWGLLRLEDPERDARSAHPLWDDGLPSLLHLWAAPGVASDAADGDAHASLDLWQIPGEKRLAALPAGYALQVRDGARILRARLGPGVLDGQPALCAVPLDARLHAQAALLAAHAARLAPRRACPAARADPAAMHRVPLAAQHHLHALQALDGVRAGASQRAIAQVLYGRDRVRAQWNADSALRAQLRHSLARGLALVRGGYLGLAGLRPATART